LKTAASPLDYAIAVLASANPATKAKVALQAADALQRLPASAGFDTPAGLRDRPARPEKPALVAPGRTPRRRLGATEGRVALLHALAHIEFNAIDLAFDMVARFSAEMAEAGLDAGRFVADWSAIGADEARHFLMLSGRLAALGAAYGDLPAHDGLWQAAVATRDDALARLAVAPMALEARGLDVTPAMAEKLDEAGDSESADILRVIHAEEVGHVAAGVRWFTALCRVRGLQPADAFGNLIAERLSGGLKPPFNVEAREAAGFPRSFYEAAAS
jgi:uncharacterized ferritin-like protein (DUF455 family)